MTARFLTGSPDSRLPGQWTPIDVDCLCVTWKECIGPEGASLRFLGRKVPRCTCACAEDTR